MSGVSFNSTTAQALSQLSTGVPVGHAFLRSGVNASFNAAGVPDDDTPPTSAEGQNLESLVYTPKRIGNVLIIEWGVQASLRSVNDNVVFWIIQNAAGNALTSCRLFSTAANDQWFHGMAQVTVSSLAAQTFSTRFGRMAVAGQVDIGMPGGVAKMGTSRPHFIRITEVTV